MRHKRWGEGCVARGQRGAGWQSAMRHVADRGGGKLAGKLLPYARVGDYLLAAEIGEEGGEIGEYAHDGGEFGGGQDVPGQSVTIIH